ncbi:MAG TPA: hypothetical protein VGM01_02565 [Ktedonobacteraceae bacterium]
MCYKRTTELIYESSLMFERSCMAFFSGLPAPVGSSLASVVSPPARASSAATLREGNRQAEKGKCSIVLLL